MNNLSITQYMNYGDHNFTEITQQTKLRVALVVSSQSSESSCAVRQCRHSQNAWARHVERVESSQVDFGLLGLTVVYNNVL